MGVFQCGNAVLQVATLQGADQVAGQEADGVGQLDIEGAFSNLIDAGGQELDNVPDAIQLHVGRVVADQGLALLAVHLAATAAGLGRGLGTRRVVQEAEVRAVPRGRPAGAALLVLTRTPAVYWHPYSYLKASS
jgi:hypothetical protein